MNVRNILSASLLLSAFATASYAKDIEFYRAQPVERIAPPNTVERATQPKRVQRNDNGQEQQNGIDQLFGVWHTKIPGGVWQSPGQVPGYDVLHIAPGVQSGDLTIDPSGNYVWNSYGGKAGKWEQGNAAYPIVLIDTVEKKKWRVGFNKREGGIYIWDGYVYYKGTR